MSIFIVHNFTGNVHTETKCIGPFYDRRLALKYKVATSRMLRPKSMREFTVETTYTDTKPEGFEYPDEQIMHSIGVI